ncbi:uncharacterized protein LOC131330752 [Rhododendron vialii]|uniref:uncharacterized protein LOC131330752 n=1 Tax=Rhododendron vialii TaxID=182163 RepID=UPI00265D8024|nr:uncharacterized protein LOC131330752 [Rhododendron vialii]
METVTLFVDNIPEQKDQMWLKRAFNKFGEVKDVFIPLKRSKSTGNKFGFVRYDCYEAANRAISRMNGVWVEKERLFVKEASFRINELKSTVKHLRPPLQKEKGIWQGVNPIQRYGNEVQKEDSRAEFYGGLGGINKSFAQALKGESSKAGPDQKNFLKIK